MPSILAALSLSLLGTTPVFASDLTIDAFASNCFSPFMTGSRAAGVLALDGGRYDFYDLRPFRPGTPVSEPAGRAPTPGTDRRCEVAFDGDHVAESVAAIEEALALEDITELADVPPDFPTLAGAAVVEARFLNPNRIAVVQVGTRPGPNGVETFMSVERLLPLNGE
ncbi:MAG: succinyl-CoA synthetase subunit beta [Pseudomonadota bacterium]